MSAIGLSIVAVATASAVDGWHYRSDPAWREFMAYNRARAFIHDLPIVTYEHNTRFFFDRVGWSYTDWGMFTNWFFTDRETFSRERLEAILHRFEGSTWSRSKSPQYLADSLRPFSDLSAARLRQPVVGDRAGRGKPIARAAGRRGRVLALE